MKTFVSSIKLLGVSGLLLLASTGCETTDGGGSASVGMYYGVGFYDPWYYGGYYYGDGDIIITPPNRPEIPAHPSHPIARPPSIPSTPRPMPRGGGGRR